MINGVGAAVLLMDDYLEGIKRRYDVTTNLPHLPLSELFIRNQVEYIVSYTRQELIEFAMNVMHCLAK